MREIAQGTARNVMVLMTAASDHVTGLAGLTLTITASKNGAAFASISPTVTDRSSGWYQLALTASHTDTVGDLALHITGASADPADLVVDVYEGRPTGLVVADGGNTATTFKTDRGETATDHWLAAFVKFTSGALIGQVRRCTAYNGTTKFVTFADAFSAAPAASDTFELINE